MQILVIGDCHGEMPEIPDSNFDLILAVGDICGGTDEMRKYMFEAIDSNQTWYELMGEEKAKKAVKASIREGHQILEKLDSLGVPVYAVPGNWDWSQENNDWRFLEDKGFEKMLEKYENIQDINFETKDFEGVSFIGYGPCSGPEIPQYEDDKPETEEEMQNTKEEYQENKGKLETLFEESKNKVIFLSHNVPHGTELDMINNPDSPKHGRHYGSIIVKELVEQYQPVFNIAGHMHEAEGKETIDQTACVNTGIHNSLILDLENKEITEL